MRGAGRQDAHAGCRQARTPLRGAGSQDAHAGCRQSGRPCGVQAVRTPLRGAGRQAGHWLNASASGSLVTYSVTKNTFRPLIQVEAGTETGSVTNAFSMLCAQLAAGLAP